jgi:uncharacterized protein (DUF433 family)
MRAVADVLEVIDPWIGYNFGIMHANEFTAAQVSWVTGLSVKAVNKAIEDAAVPVRVARVRGARRRYIPYASLVCLQLHAQGLNRLPLRLRREIFRRVVKEPVGKQLRYSEALIIDLDGVRSKMQDKLRDLARAARTIHSDPEIMAGTPVVRGTRIPAHLIADMLEQGTRVEEILEGYPSLTRALVEDARIFAATHPKRGRPPVRPWAGKKPATRKKTGKLGRVA